MSNVNQASQGCSSNCSGCKSGCSSRQQPYKNNLLVPVNKDSNVKKVIGIVSGKGGVGKSFVTSYVSVLMNRKGYKTAILDGDITGPSIPKAFGIHKKAVMNEKGIIPEVSELGTKVMSINLALDTEDTPVIWRGPVIGNTVKQFWTDVVWEDVDYMFVDMPPGTGDVPLTVFQSLPVDAIIIVTSPQELVSMIVAKAVNMANSMNIPILGLVENYSYLECGDCGNRIHVFGESHIDEISEKHELKVLGRIPINPVIAQAVDKGAIESLEGNWLDGVVEELETTHKVELPKKNSKKIIAVATDERNNVNQHFGKTETFTVYELQGNELISKNTLSCFEEGHESRVVLLVKEGVNVVICGGLGEHASKGLMDANITLVTGASGDIDVVTSAYLDGSV